MKRYVRTPSGMLGLIAIALILALGGVVGFFWASTSRAANRQDSSDRRIECIARQLGQPWIGLKESFGSPAGDQAARDRALAAVNAGIERIEHLDRYCP